MAYYLEWRLRNIPRLNTLGRTPDEQGKYKGWPYYWFGYNDYLIDVIITSACDPTRASVDVGCHKGRFTGWMATCSSRAYAFDPDTSKMFEGAKAMWKNRLSWARERKDKTMLIPVALGDQKCTMELYQTVSPNGRSASGWNSLLEQHHEDSLKLTVGSTKTVQVERLDDMVQEPVAFVKVDAEGYDAKVLLGATRILQQDRPVVVVESGKHVRDYLISLLGSMGYSTWPLGWPLQGPSDDPRHYMLNMLAIPQELNPNRILNNVNELVRFVEQLMEMEPTPEGFARIRPWMESNLPRFRTWPSSVAPLNSTG